MTVATETGRSVQEIIANEIQYEIDSVPLELARNAEIGDHLLKIIVLENRLPTYAESTFFQSKLGLDFKQLRAELSRMRIVVSRQAIVGTQKQREAAEAERLAALDALATEKPKLVKKLEAIQEQIAALERSATNAEKRTEQIELAVVELQKPEHLRSDLREAVRVKNREFAESTWGPMNALETNIRHLELILSPTCSVDSIAEHAKRDFPECITRNDLTGAFEFVEPAWSQRKQMMRTELDEMREKFHELAAVKEQQMAELADLAAFYLRSNG